MVWETPQNNFRMFFEEFSSVIFNKAEVFFPLYPTPEQCILRLILGENEKGKFTWLTLKKKSAVWDTAKKYFRIFKFK